MKKVFSVLIVLLSFFMVFPAFAEDRLIDKDADWWAQATPEVVENMIKDETDVNVTWEDQQMICRFSVLNQFFNDDKTLLDMQEVLSFS